MEPAQDNTPTVRCNPAFLARHSHITPAPLAFLQRARKAKRSRPSSATPPSADQVFTKAFLKTALDGGARKALTVKRLTDTHNALLTVNQGADAVPPGLHAVVKTLADKRLREHKEQVLSFPNNTAITNKHKPCSCGSHTHYPLCTHNCIARLSAC